MKSILFFIFHSIVDFVCLYIHKNSQEIFLCDLIFFNSLNGF